MLLQKPLSLLRAAASMLEHMPPGTWMRLVALHIHCLRQLSLHLVVSTTALLFTTCVCPDLRLQK